MSLPSVAIEYVEHLAAGQFAAAAHCIPEGSFHSHPFYDPNLTGPTSRRREASDREVIERLFEARGHRASRSDTFGDRFYMERVTEESGAELLSYLAGGTVAGHGGGVG